MQIVLTGLVLVQLIGLGVRYYGGEGEGGRDGAGFFFQLVTLGLTVIVVAVYFAALWPAGAAR